MTAMPARQPSIEWPPLPTDLTPPEQAALRLATAATSSQGQLRVAHRDLERLLTPLHAAATGLRLDPSACQATRRSMLCTMAESGRAYGAWDTGTWIVAARSAGRFAPNVLAIACRFGCLTGQDVLTYGVKPTPFAWRLFGQETFDRELHRIQSYLTTVGYGRKAPHHPTLSGALARLLILAGRPELEAVTVEIIEAAHQRAPMGSDLRSAYFRLARVLHGMGILPREIPFRSYQTDALQGVDPAWAAWCGRWRETSTLAPETRHGIYYSLLKAGRWLAQHHPVVRSPDDWTREIALAYVAAVNKFVVGELSAPSSHQAYRSGIPLSARSKNRLLGALRIFFQDCQEWGWAVRRFDPRRTFATPRAVRALIGPNPRVIADDIWAKLLWAGLNLRTEDLATFSVGQSAQPNLVYPLDLVQALAVTWLFAGLRRNELMRLRVGCIRWQRHDGGPAAAPLPGDGATCLLDVPVHKTGTSYTKPVDALVGEAIARWEAQRPVQPLQTDPKTGEQVAFLFCWRGRPIPSRYLNRTLIPLLCRKAGVPASDARGRITSHRARSTIATQLYNAKEPMTLFELQEWLGHRSPATTQHYARITPTTLAKAYADAGYFARNVRTIEVLIDREAVQSGAAAGGAPWQYFDLGHGYCTYTFFEQCPHRMACARCDFYLPKSGTKAQLLEAKGHLQRMLHAIPLTEEERAAVEDGAAAVDQLLERLIDVPTPAGPTPRELSPRTIIPLRPVDASPSSEETIP